MSIVDGRTGNLTQIIQSRETPHGQAKLTLEALEHWRARLTHELKRLVADIEATEAMAHLWCGKCAESLAQLRELHEKKNNDLSDVLKAITDIQHDIGAATLVAQGTSECKSPMLLIPRKVGHGPTNALLKSALDPAVARATTLGPPRTTDAGA